MSWLPVGYQLATELATSWLPVGYQLATSSVGYQLATELATRHLFSAGAAPAGLPAGQN